MRTLLLEEPHVEVRGAELLVDDLKPQLELRRVELPVENSKLQDLAVRVAANESLDVAVRLLADHGEDQQMRMLEDQLKDLEAATQRQRERLEIQIRQLRELRDVREAAARIENHPHPVQDRYVREFERQLLGEDLMVVHPEWKLGIVLVEPEEGKPGLGVTAVEPESPAASANIQVGDRVTSCNGISLKSVLALRLIIQAAQDQELKLMVSRDGNPEALGFAVTPVRVVRPAEASGGGGLAAPGGGLVIPRMAPYYLENLKPVPRERIEWRQGDREVLERLDEVEKVLANIRELLEKAGIGRAEGGDAPEDPAEVGGAADE